MTYIRVFIKFNQKKRLCFLGHTHTYIYELRSGSYHSGRIIPKIMFSIFRALSNCIVTFSSMKRYNNLLTSSVDNVSCCICVQWRLRWAYTYQCLITWHISLYFLLIQSYVCSPTCLTLSTYGRILAHLHQTNCENIVTKWEFSPSAILF